MKRVKFMALACAVMMSLCACGGTEETQSSTPAAVSTESASSTEAAKPSESQPAETVTSEFAAEAKKMLGEWVGVYSESVYYEDGEEDSYFYFLGVPDEDAEGEYYGEDMRIQIYEEDGKLRLDQFADYDYGMELVPTAGAAYDGCKNSTWKAKVKFGQTERASEVTASLISDNVLEYIVRFTDDSDYVIYTTTFFRSGSEEYNHAENYRYPNQVTVSNPYDLIQAMKTNTKITVTGGVYDLTEFEHYSGLTNVCIEAAAGEKVELVTREPAAPVLEFENCESIAIRGVTVGHQVEKGYCNGSVLDFNNCSDVTVEDCHLYGCGTYGISASNSYTGWISNTEIYECSEGLVYFFNCGNWTFDQCEMRDTEGAVPIDVYACWAIHFQDCDFHGVEVGAECYFVNDTDGAVSFNHCSFRDLDPGLLSDTDVYTENCTFQ